jgi:GNAT superfamily N-acetyltransferase
VTHEEELRLSLDTFAQRLQPVAGEKIVIGAFEEEELIAFAGALRETRTKSRHKATLWGMFVAPAYRGRGIAGALVQGLVDEVRTWPGLARLNLIVNEHAIAARRLYLFHGFVIYGHEPDAMREGDRSDAIDLMTLVL